MAAPQSTLRHIDSLLSDIDYNVPPPSAKRKPHPHPESVRSYDYRNQLIVASQYVLNKLGRAPIALVLGSGLGGFSDKLQDRKELPYEQIPFLPLP
eukprot:377453_1